MLKIYKEEKPVPLQPLQPLVFPDNYSLAGSGSQANKKPLPAG
jgi:hypothetical protein